MKSIKHQKATTGTDPNTMTNYVKNQETVRSELIWAFLTVNKNLSFNFSDTAIHYPNICLIFIKTQKLHPSLLLIEKNEKNNP